MLVTCGRCGHQNLANSRVCARCAAPLTNLSPSCGFENPPGFNFCGSCGASLIATTLPQDQRTDALKRLQAHIPGDLVDKILRVGQQMEGERRNVTILFTDVVGFTTLSEKLDPEQVFTIIEQVQRAFLAEIYTHEGWFDKFLGDGLMAIFGAPEYHENHREQAVNAAREMIKLLNTFNEQRGGQKKVKIRVGIGIATGRVIAGFTGTQHRATYTCVGDTVNVAARIEDHTKVTLMPILIDQNTRDGLPDDIQVEGLGSVLFKGKQQPINIFAVK